MPRRNSFTRAPGAYLPFPLWLRFAISGTIALVLLVAMVVFVSGHNTDSPTSTNVTAAVQANRDAEILIAQDQAPHIARLSTSATAASGLLHALRAYVARQTAGGAVSGPLGRSVCRPTRPRGGAQRGFSCTVTAGGVNYEFLAALDPSARRITYCKSDPPPAPTDRVPVSPRCLG